MTGIGFVAVLVASFSVAPIPPQRGATADAIRRYFVDHAAGIRASALLQSVASIFLLLFVCWLAETVTSEMRGRLATMAVLGAGVLTLAASLAGAAVSATLASGVASTADAALLRALFDLGNLALNVGNPMVALLVGVHTFATHDRSWMPRWLTGLGLITAVSWALESISIIVTSGPFASPTGPYGLAMVSLLLAWIVAVSLVLRHVTLGDHSTLA